MAKKPKKKDIIAKQTGAPGARSLDDQAMDDTLTIEEVRQFIADAEKKAAEYLNLADRSWREIERRDKSGKLPQETSLQAYKRWNKFPLWWSVWKIRQPITFARLPIPTLKDTQGDDPYGRTACVVGERLTRGILKTFEMFPEISAANDDFLVTNFAWGRAFYRNELCEEPEKIRLQVMQPPPMPQSPQEEMAEPMQEPQAQEMQEQMQPMPPIFLTPDGMQVDPSTVLTDEMGPYLLTGREISVDNEEVYFEAGLYPNLIVDPDAVRYNKVTRLAYKYQYSYREFKEKYGQEALNTLTDIDIEKHRTGTPIICYEYWDKTLKEVRWLAENSQDFFQPKEIREIDIESLREVEPDDKLKDSSGADNSDLYGLTGFFPSTEPLVINQSTKSFWPTPEYFQVCDILDDISSIVGRMIHLTKAIRVRFLFDSSVAELKTLIGDNWAASEGSGLGIPNLAAALMNDKNADLSRLVAYFPVEKLIEGLNNMYTAFDQRLNMFYQVTGISDLIRGQTNPDSDKTFGERQMEGKFALNRIEPYQRKLQEWIKDQYQLLMELALKMFSDETLDKYITPQTLDKEDKQRYEGALQLLRDNKKRRFRVDFETDSTIAINEQWKRGQAIETANVITKMQEAVAKTATDFPELVESQLKIMNHVIGELSDGKLFLDEIQESIQATIDKVNKPKPPEPNIELEKLKLDDARFQLEQQKAVTDDKLEQLKLTMEGQLEGAKLAQADKLAQIEASITQFKIQADSQTKQAQIQADFAQSQAELQKEYQKISADISLERERMQIEVQKVMVNLREIADKKELATFEAMLQARLQKYEETLGIQQQALEAYKVKIEAHDAHISLQERIATEQRLQDEHSRDKVTQGIDNLHTLMEVALKKKEIDTPAVETQKETKPRKKTSKVVRDKEGNIDKIIHEEE